MATIIHRCRPLCSRACSGKTSRAPSRHRNHPLRPFSSTSISQARNTRNDDIGTSQRKPRDPVTRDTNAPFDRSNYNPRIKSKQLPEGFKAKKSLDAEIREARSSQLPDRGRGRGRVALDEDDEDDGLVDIDYDRYAEQSQRKGSLVTGTPISSHFLGEEPTTGREIRDRQLAVGVAEEELDEDGEEIEEDEEPDDPREDKIKGGFFALEEERDDPGEDPEFENDDITSLAHGELEQHRELRAFYRAISWDMPLLHNHAQAFIPPTTATPLRFRYTTYLGETHPASRKVVCTFKPSDLPSLAPPQVTKLLKLLGPRYDSIKDEAKLSCEQHATTAQNKRHLGDSLTKLMDEARNGEDMFEDVPLDLRHMRKRSEKERRRNLVFPQDWKMTDERRRQLEEGWKVQAQKEIEAREQMLLVDGAEMVKKALSPVMRTEAVEATVPIREKAPLPRQRTVLR